MTPETKITEHFTYRELTNSATGRRLGLENKPNEQELANIKKTAERLEKIRAWLGKKYGREVSIHVLSCFRSAAVNGAVGGSKTSARRRILMRPASLICNWHAILSKCAMLGKSRLTS